ncbi:MAG TPA: DUF3179 domain-containing (seleno)protein [Chthonomonadaceae bacterium]|nr:DUF3179 domain-containing (seleno)protein [Chthonomonadaceae bacterium]
MKGPIAPGIVPEALWDGRKMVEFHSLDTPNMVKAADADFIEPSEYVLGVTVDGQSRAYPARFIFWHHVVNDKVTAPGKPDNWFAVTYCSVCNTGIRYSLFLDGRSRRLDFFGLYNGIVTLCDRQTESVFLQAGGSYVTGPLLGKELQVEPLLDTTWGEWRRLHPDTLVMSPDSGYGSRYPPKGVVVQRGNPSFPAPFFQASLTRVDKRLPMFEMVLGVTIGKSGDAARSRRAYPVKSLSERGGVVDDTLADAPIAVLFDPATASASAVSRRIDGRTLTFEARKGDDGKAAFFDKETDTRWSIEGLGEAGPLAGKSLTRLNAHLSQWYGWFATFPETTIYGRSDPPQPGEPFAKEVPATGAPK